MDDRGAVALAESDSFPRLAYLDLSSTAITGTGVGAILSSPKLRNLRQVQLSGAGITQFKSADFGPEPTPSLRTVNLTSNPNLDGQHLAPLFELLSRSNVVMLDLTGTQLGAHGMKALAKTTGWKQLRALLLNFCKLNTAAAVALADWPGLAGVERLAMMDPNPIGQRGADAIAKSPHLGKIRQIIMPLTTPALHKKFGSKLSTRDRMYS
ncbi:MAG: hypothetical protein L0241_19495 [Planctomycetia bacterium]|nr:hypothetical protein [Planctomycetia bacterium]